MRNWTRLSAVLVFVTCALLLGVAPAYATYGKLTVVKSLTPSTDSGRFNLFIKDNSGNTQASVSAVGNGGSVSKTVLYGTYKVQETAATGSSLSDYDASIVCKKSSGTTVASGSGSGPLAVYVAVADDIKCTISNKRKPEIRVVKHLVPSSDGGLFDLQIDGVTKSGSGGVGDGGDTGFVQLAAGSHMVGELAHRGTSLGNYRSSVDCDSGKGSADPGTSQAFSVAYGDKVTCTITNTLVPPDVAIDKTGPTLAHDGDKLTYTITVTNPGATTLRDVMVTDAITGQTHGCDAGGGPTLTGGDSNGDGRLQATETWTYSCGYTVRHADENAQHEIVNVATVTANDDSGHTAGPKDDDATTKVIHPAIAIDKSGPATGEAGQKIGYVLAVTNPGDTPLADATVKLADANCDGDPVTLIGKGGDISPSSLDPGDVWTYSCSVQTAAGETVVHNTASVTGCDQLGGCVNAEDSADTTLTQPQQMVLPARITPGTAKLSGPSGCASHAFYARIRGTKLASVTFVLDGKVIKRFTKPNAKTLLRVRIVPKKLRLGVHRLVVNVKFAAGSGTKPKTLRLSFQRCARRLQSPRFTG